MGTTCNKCRTPLGNIISSWDYSSNVATVDRNVLNKNDDSVIKKDEPPAAISDDVSSFGDLFFSDNKSISK